MALGLPLEDQPDLAAQPAHAAMVAGWLWQDRRVNVAADRGNIGMITRAITSRPGHMPVRHELYQAALMALEG
jgi:putative chitinase